MNTLTKLALKGVLEDLNDLYNKNDFETYQRALEESRTRLFYAFPGLTIVRCEVVDRNYALTMTHVLAPEPIDTIHELGWHDTMLACLSLDDGKTPVWEIASMEVQQPNGSWLAGTVASGGAAGQSHFVTTSTGEQYTLKYGDTVRKVVFKDRKKERG